MNTIAERLQSAYQQITQECSKLGSNPANVQLIAVSKTKPASAIEAAYQHGQRHFAENYPQELADKALQLQYPDLIWHFIGPLQSNKTRLVAEHASWFHSLDRLKIARRLSEQRQEQQAPLQVLIQLNISGESTKAGIQPEDMMALAADIAQLPNLTLRGLMAIPAPSDQHPVEHSFQRMQQLSQQLQRTYPAATELSMGMSNDWPMALRYGATMIRLGTAIFGERTYERNE